MIEKLFDQYNLIVALPIEPAEERGPAGLMVVEPACNTAGRNESAGGRNDKTAARVDRAKRRRQNAEQEYRDEVYRQWLAAEAATNGYMLNPAGRRSGIDERSLFVGPESRVRKYASPELIDWFESHPRPTRASWFGSPSARHAHRAGRRIG